VRRSACSKGTRVRAFGVVLLVLLLGSAVPGGPPPGYVQEIPGSTVSFEMVYIPGGRARLGTPPRDAEVAPFFIGKREVTWAEFEQYYLSASSSSAPPGADAVSRPSPSYHPHDHDWGRGKRPAMGLSLHAAATYCEWLSTKTGVAYRLPTEDEWEFAARAGSAADAPDAPLEAAWCAENAGKKTQEAGTKSPNAFGLHDMLGNVWEYCSGPLDPATQRPIIRGGSYREKALDLRFDLRQPVLDKWNERDPQRPRSRWWIVDGPFVGFRVARSAERKD